MQRTAITRGGSGGARQPSGSEPPPVEAPPPPELSRSSAQPQLEYLGAFPGAWKWHGGITAGNGEVYCIPCSGSSVLVIDPRRGSAETFGNVGGTKSYKWNRACLA